MYFNDRTKLLCHRPMEFGGGGGAEMSRRGKFAATGIRRGGGRSGMGIESVVRGRIGRQGELRGRWSGEERE